MGVIDGQRVNQTITNPAFINKNIDDIMPNVLGFTCPTEGGDLASIQETANNLYAATGVSEVATGTAYNATPSTINNGDNYLTALYKLAEKFHPATGHAHTGAAGDGPMITAGSIGTVPLLGYLQLGIALTSVSGSSLVVTSQLSGKTPSSSSSTAGVCVTSPSNKVRILNDYDQDFVDSFGNLVYGRITYAATVWTLSFYSESLGIEVSYSFPSPINIHWYYQELFNPLGSPPVYDQTVQLFTSNKVNSLAASGSPVYGNIIFAGGESIGIAQSLNTFTIGISGKFATNRIPVMVGCSSVADGLQGAVPAPTAGQQSLFLRADGTWRNAGAGSVTSVGLSVPAFLSVAGSPVTGSGTLAVSLSGTALPVANGGTGVTSVTTAPIASSFSGWDANKNLSANSLIEGYTTTATAAGTTTLVVGSTFQQYFTGSTTQTVALPVTSTLVVGQSFQIVNLSSGVITVNSSGGNLVQSVAVNSCCIVTCISTSGTTAASWSVIANAVGASLPPTIQKLTTGSGTYTTPTNPSPLYIRVRMVGAGGGGSGSGNGNNGGTGGTGGNSTFGTSLLVANGGVGGVDLPGLNSGGSGGTASLGTGPIGTALTGGSGANAPNILAGAGGNGGTNHLGGAGMGGSGGGNAGTPGVTNTGAGGGGGSSATAVGPGAGGGAGGFVDAIIVNPASSYSWACGAAGTAGTAGTLGFAGGAGGSGYIEVLEVYPIVNTVIVSGSPSTPTVQKLTTGSGTYTTPTNPAPAYIRVRMVGGGGGGWGSGSSQGSSPSAGGNTTFGTSLLAANGGAIASAYNGVLGGAGGSASLGTGPIGTSLSGGYGNGASFANNTTNAIVGANGGNTAFAGGGSGGSAGNAGGAGVTNTGGGGGGGGGVTGVANNSGPGGGGGGFVDAIIINPLSTYSYTVGTSGTAGGAGGSGLAGGAGGSGYIEVTEYYVGNSVGGTPIANQTANTAYLGPSSGGAATPGFRALVGADVLGQGTITKFTSNGTFTTPSNSSTSTIYQYMILGSGGGGGGTNGAGAISSGGGAGALAIGTFTGVAPSTGITVTVGAAGTAGSNTGSNGGTGGSSLLGSPVSVTCTGGVGGTGSTSGVSSIVGGGAGGTVSVGSPTLSIPGQSGGAGVYITGNFGITGSGGSSHFGCGAQPGLNASGVGNVIASAATGYGSGGGGAIGVAGVGYIGTGGLVLITQLTP